jgi:hypothetical protein
MPSLREVIMRVMPIILPLIIISPEIINHLMDNQQKINQLFEQQAVLFERLLGK